MGHLKSTVLAVIVGFFALAAITSNVGACGINTTLKPPPISDFIDNADIVVIGKAIGGGFTRNGATIRVEKYLKGNGPDILFTEGYIKLPAYCRSGDDFWSRKIYYFRDEEDTAAPIGAWQIWTFKNSQTADGEAVAEISSYTGQLTESNPSSFHVRIVAALVFLNTDDFLLITNAFLFPMSIVLAIFLVRRVVLRRKRLKLAMQI